MKLRDLFLLYLSAISFCALSQDSTKFEKSAFGVVSFGREVGDLSQTPNEFYLQSLVGYKFSNEFGIAAGPGLIYYNRYSFLPLVASIRKNGTTSKRIGLLFDIGYMFPLRGDGDDFQLNYSITKGGSFFNPQLTALVYESKVLVYFNFGYKVYSFTETYNPQFNPENEVEDRITARFINFGVTIEFK
jgi:hypothetical protein